MEKDESDYENQTAGKTTGEAIENSPVAGQGHMDRCFLFYLFWFDSLSDLSFGETLSSGSAGRGDAGAGVLPPLSKSS